MIHDGNDLMKSKQRDNTNAEAKSVVERHQGPDFCHYPTPKTHSQPSKLKTEEIEKAAHHPDAN
jgi:hypothetical protein